MRAKNRLDAIGIGFITGIILPAFVLFLFYASTYAYLTVPDFLRKMAFQAIIIKLVSLCAVVNLGGFFLFYQLKKDKSARGVILATLILAIVVMIKKIQGGTL